MASPFTPRSSKQARAANAVRLAQTGDLDGAKIAFEEAIKLDRRDPALLFNLAIIEEQRGDADAAASRLTHLLALKPNFPAAASRLSRLLARFQISDLSRLSDAGLKVALLDSRASHQPIVDAAMAWLFSAGTGSALVNGFKDLNPLLILALRAGIVKSHVHELTLTRVRASLLLHRDAASFADRQVMELTVALLVQGWNNDHAWAETPAETAALNALAIDRGRLADGDVEASRRFLLHALYRPLDQIVTPPLSIEEARRLKPRRLRETMTPHLEAQERQRQFAQNVRVLRPLADKTSRRVASQYEAAPYPRWQSLHRSQAGSLKRALERHFPIDALAFMDHPFDVLIAGCGTGQQALQSAIAYGPQAHLTAMDLSAASLGYASDMAQAHAVDHVSFVQGDILDCGMLDRAFDIIECVGVLHHMADWRVGWSALLDKLKPGGLMYIGLYSAASRSNLKALRNEPSYPGPGCSDTAARNYRHQLMLRAEGTPGSELKGSRDFYALHAFRDLVLHESEAHVTLEEIATFLKHNGLAFRGFTIEPQVAADFASAYPQSSWPGSLTEWTSFERAHPRTFDAMYRFWVEREPSFRL